jgi:protein-disulfide isomerase
MAKNNRGLAGASQPSRIQEIGGMSTGVAFIGFILSFLAGGLLMWGYDQHRIKAGGGIAADDSSSAATGGAWSDEESPIAVSSKDPMKGLRGAPVTIVEWSDFQCPFCSKVEPTLKQIQTTYGDKVRIIWKNEPLPFHPNAKPAAEAAQGTFALGGNDAFWKFHDSAYTNQSALSPDNYEKWAKDAGVKDMAKWKAGIAAHTFAQKVDDDNAAGQKAGANGTPHFFINGVELSGAQPFEKFKEVIDAELSKAQAKIASGTPKDRIYVAMSQDNKKNAPAPAKAKDDSGEKKDDDTTVWKVAVGNAPVLGPVNAPVTIVEFSDFQCPFCSKVEPTLKAVMAKYKDKVRLVWKNEPLPFHPRAKPCAELAMEARAEKKDPGFWAAHDKLFDNQKAQSDDDLAKYAADLGLNVDKVKAAIANNTYAKDIDADADEGDDVQASGTPHFFINGRRLVGAQPEEKFDAIIDQEIKHAADLVSKGTKPEAVYDAIMKDGKGTPDPEKKATTVPTTSPWKGGEHAKVTIVEWSDFECPFCGRVEDTVKQINDTYKDKIKFVWRDMPLPMHPDAPLAAEAGREAFKQKGPTAFWAMHDKMYGNQKDLKRETLDGYATGLGLDMDKWKSSLDNMVYKAGVDADAKAGNDIGITGTPAFIILPSGAKEGYYISGAQPFTKFRKLIDRAFAEAK